MHAGEAGELLHQILRVLLDPVQLFVAFVQRVKKVPDLLRNFVRWEIS